MRPRNLPGSFSGFAAQSHPLATYPKAVMAVILRFGAEWTYQASAFDLRRFVLRARNQLLEAGTGRKILASFEPKHVLPPPLHQTT